MIGWVSLYALQSDYAERELRVLDGRLRRRVRAVLTKDGFGDDGDDGGAKMEKLVMANESGFRTERKGGVDCGNSIN